MDEIGDFIDGDLVMDIPSMCSENEECSMDVPSMCSLTESYCEDIPSMCSISPLCSEDVPSEHTVSPRCNVVDFLDNMYPDGYEFLLTHSDSWQLEDAMWVPHVESTEVTIVDINSDEVLASSKIECQEGNMLPRIESKDETSQNEPKIAEQYPERRTSPNNVCDEQLEAKVTLNSHKLIHSNESEDRHEHINEKKFEYKPNIIKVELYPGKRTFQCDICNKLLATKSTLNRHQLIHSATKRFKCDECEKEFTYKCNLDTHKLNHSNVRAFMCEECGKDFTQKCRLVAHEMIHTGVKAFECDICRKTFTSKSTLNRHKVTHSGIKRFKCDECGKKFNEKCNLDVHQRIHIGFKPFQCEICEKSFSRKHSLNTHKKMHVRKAYIKSEETYDSVPLDFK